MIKLQHRENEISYLKCSGIVCSLYVISLYAKGPRFVQDDLRLFDNFMGSAPYGRSACHDQFNDPIFTTQHNAV